ncbi:[FeFe] hydrogenase H-cluster radical SAM maturase HydE [Pleomorphochaeta sp. DL1XJH-081]|jgi:biotin synthase|uniref:[FeFe] hydrogenase H-cluster radical SAM maturase HydE n=1 Tax=Pleomorphochaeta sp. DL1XJH-081 TaxID=3409690 RepID=UPI003BB6C50D
MTRKELIEILSIPHTDTSAIEDLKRRAGEVMVKEVGTDVYYRGIIEFSNICTLDCHYCGIRRSNSRVTDRYTLSKQEIIDTALWCRDAGYGSLVLQSGERRDQPFISFVEDLIMTLRRESVSPRLPEGLGITLGVGEQDEHTYQRLADAGAHRYLLRIETTNEALYRRLHPSSQRLSERISCLRSLRKIGFQVGTGVMIGLPGQSIDMLADDILFFRDMDVDMIGMGPYIVHEDSPMARQGMMEKEALMQLSLNMIAAVRLALKDVNIASTTALQALYPDGRERGLAYGANVTMPNLTPQDVRKGYQLYQGKPCVEESKNECRECLLGRITSIGRKVGFDAWGDSPHALQRTQARQVLS